MEESVMFPRPNVGVTSVIGRKNKMEDMVQVSMDLCDPNITDYLPIHFFAVYDGHGGSHVSSLCKERLHEYLKEELMEMDNENNISSNNNNEEEITRMESKWIEVMKKVFGRMDETALVSCGCSADDVSCRCFPLSAFLTGSTAIVVVVTPFHIIVANCGDSRAVLSRGRVYLPLSIDHKPNRPDEAARIEAAGGNIVDIDGLRVQGILSMTRAIGDKFIKKYVISEPEITITKRHQDDECVVLASDGLWDVLKTDSVCRLATLSLRRGTFPCLPTWATNPTALRGVRYSTNVRPTPPTPTTTTTSTPPSALAALGLTRIAMGLGSSDNISVIVVDLKGR